MSFYKFGIEKNMLPPRWISFLCLSLIVLLSACGKPKPGDASYVLAEGKGFKITNADLDRAVGEQVARIKKSGYEPSSKQIEEIRKRNLPFVIDEKLIELEIARIKPSNLEKLVASQTEKLGKKNGEKEAPDPSHIENIRRRISWELVLQDHSKQIQAPGEKEARLLYEKNPGRWQVPGSVSGTQFLLPMPPSAPESAWKTAKASLAEAQKKVKENVATGTIQKDRASKKMSPLLVSSTSWTKQELPKEFADRFDKLRSGEATEIIKTSRGLIFYRFEQVSPSRKFTLEEALPRIQEQMKQDQLSTLRRNLLKDLRQTYQVRIIAPEAAPAS